MINKETGEIWFPDWDVKISPSLTREAFLKSTLSKTAKVKVKNEPYCSWKLAPTKWQDRKWWNIIVFFKEEKLYQVNLAASETESGSPWEDWSEESEIGKKNYYIEFLGELLGFSGVEHRGFSWGTVKAIYDQKTGGSYIIVKF